MRSINLDVNLDKWGISEENIANLGEATIRGYRKGLKELQERAEEKLRMNMMIYGLSGSEYAGSVQIIENGYDGFSVIALKHMLYVEFGTGLVGAGQNADKQGRMSPPHPKQDLSPDFEGYDLKNHGMEGWYYLDASGKLKHTYGQIAKPVIYQTWLYIRRATYPIINGAIEKELSKL